MYEETSVLRVNFAHFSYKIHAYCGVWQSPCVDEHVLLLDCYTASLCMATSTLTYCLQFLHHMAVVYLAAFAIAPPEKCSCLSTLYYIFMVTKFIVDEELKKCKT